MRMDNQVYALIVQALGVLGLCFGVLSFQSNKSKNIVKLKLLNDFIFSIQYILLDAITGAVMNIISCFRNLIYINCDKKNKNTYSWMVLFSVIMLVMGVITWDSPFSLLAIAGKIISTVSYGLKDAKKVRLLTLPSSIGWLIYDSYYHSVGGVMNQLLIILSILISIIRYDILKKGMRK